MLVLIMVMMMVMVMDGGAGVSGDMDLPVERMVRMGLGTKINYKKTNTKIIIGTHASSHW